MKNKFLIGLLFFSFTLSFAQDGKVTNHIYEGNEEAQKESYIKAEKSYRKALSLAPEKSTALYNLGNTHFLDKKYDEASQRFFQTQKVANSKEDKHKAFHNMGNVYMQKKEYQKAVEAYKNGLRNNPTDEETRYNYALAKELLENENPPEEQEQDDKKDKQDKDQEDEKEKDQEGDKENKDEQDQEKEGDEGDESKDEGEPKNEGDQNKDSQPNEGENNSEKKKQPPRQGQLSPQQVQSLLDAMNNQEKKVQDKVNAKKVKGVPVRGKKDW